jgi:Arc/MetJ family transcription regulator
MAAPARVTCWGELRGERRLPGVLRVLVDGQHAGAIERNGTTWHAARRARALGRVQVTEHPTVEDALRAVLRSGFARQLGARAASPVFWSDRARRAAARRASPRVAAYQGGQR